MFEKMEAMEPTPDHPIQKWFFQLEPAQQRGVFWGAILLVGMLLVGLLARSRRSEGSRFGVREHERGVRSSNKSHARPLLLSGARLDVPAHELLGVPRDATREEIQKAYRAQVLRYHPDRIGQSGGTSSEVQKASAQIVHALTQARDTLLKDFKER